MARRASGSEERFVGDWFPVSMPCPRCGGQTRARTSGPRQLALPWAEDSGQGSTIEWRCARSLDQCTGPTAQETLDHAARLVPPLDRPRRIDAFGPAAILTCTLCGAQWGRALARCPIDQGTLVATGGIRRIA